MGHKQTATHRFGKASYHQIGLVRGQFGGVPENVWIPFLQNAGFDGWEEASWELDLRRCDTDAGEQPLLVMPEPVQTTILMSYGYSG